MNLTTLKSILDSQFSPPFLAEGLVETRWITWYDEPALSIKIGRRDVVIDESGEIIAEGTSLCTS
jgi:hypothetical protein